MSANPISPEFLVESGIVSRETLPRLKTYAALLEKWQGAINLVGKDTLPDLWRRHILNSAQIAEFIPPSRADGSSLTILDLGSGAGFPGMVLTILAADRGRQWQVHLVESDSRKCAFLATVARETGVQVTIHPKRIEQLAPFPVDVVTARALAPLATLLEYAEPFLAYRTVCLFLKGANVGEELTAATKSWKMQVERQPSRSGPTGILLHIREISRDTSTS